MFCCFRTCVAKTDNAYRHTPGQRGTPPTGSLAGGFYRRATRLDKMEAREGRFSESQGQGIW